jgi:hypothetical protein
MRVIWTRLRIFIMPLILILFLVILQLQTELSQLQTLPSPGWSRAMKASPTLETSTLPLVQLNQKQSVHFYLSKGNEVFHVAMTPKLQVIKKTPFKLDGPIQSLLWAKENQFIYQKGKALYFYSQSKSTKVSSTFDKATALSNVLIYSKLNHLIEFIPDTKGSSEIAAFAAPVYSIQSTGMDRTLLVTTQNQSNHQLTFFLLKDQAEKGFSVQKLGFILPKKNQRLESSLITKTNTTYFSVFAFSITGGPTQLEKVEIPIPSVDQGFVGRPKAHPFIIHAEAKGKPLTSFMDLTLSSKNGKPVLLFIGSKRDHLENQVMIAEQNKAGEWIAQKRSIPLPPKSTPFWALSTHQLIGWLTPENKTVKTIEFTSHDPALIQSSLSLTKRDLIHATQRTVSKMDRLGGFILISLLAGLPALLVFFILKRWAKGLLNSRHIHATVLGLFLVAEGEVVHHFIFTLIDLPTYLTFPFNSVVYILGLALVSFLLTKWLSPTSWSIKSKATYGMTVFLLLLTFLVGPYFT